MHDATDVQVFYPQEPRHTGAAFGAAADSLPP
jgi:hypothetical protein